MNLGDVMEEVAARLDTIDGLRVVSYPDGKVNPPCAVVALPDEITYDLAYQRGEDRMALPIVVLVAAKLTRLSRDQLSAYCDGVGPSSVKAVLETGWTPVSFGTITVASVRFEEWTQGAVDYPAAIFETEISGRGTT